MSSKYISFRLGLILLLQGIAPVWAEEASPNDQLLTLRQAIAEVLSVNPDIQVAQAWVTAAKERIPQAKALDDPMVGVEFYNVPIDTADITRSDDIDYKIRQNIPFPGKRHVRGKMARFDATAEGEKAQGHIQNVLLDLKQTYYNLYRMDRLRGVNQDNQRLFRQFLGSAETAYATGKTTAEVPLKAQVELSKLENEDILLNQERTAHMSHLKALLHRPTHEEIKLATTFQRPRLNLSLEVLQKTARGQRPELTTLDALSKRDRSAVTEAKQNFIPDFSFGFAYKQKPTGQDVWAAEAMINVPLFWGKKQAAVREAKAKRHATEAEQQSMLLHTQHEVDQAYAAVQASEKLMASYEGRILPQAKTNLEAAQTAYASGRIDFLTLVDAAKTYKDLKGSYYETQARLGIAFAELERLVGQSLNREAL